MNTITRTATSHLKPIAQAGLVAKGLVYSLFGILTFMAAFNINGQSADDTSKDGVFEFVYRQTGGQILLGVIALGLICYCIWRFIQTFADTEHKGKDAKGLGKRARYFFSGLVYAALAFSVIRMLLTHAKKSGDEKQDMAKELLSQPMGQWLLGIAALIIVGVGIYQLYYGLSEKYKKHVDKVIHDNNKRKVLLGAGKIGYIARGVVWLLIAWLLLKAAWDVNSKEAGDTSKAFDYLQDWPLGPYLLAAVGFGLICYGVFSFIRAGYEDLGS
jgi:hypothetical protein